MKWEEPVSATVTMEARSGEAQRKGKHTIPGTARDKAVARSSFDPVYDNVVDAGSTRGISVSEVSFIIHRMNEWKLVYLFHD